jgi:pheromone alpha factor receptor
MSLPVPTPDPNSAAWNLYIDSQSFNLTGPDGTPVQVSLVDVNRTIYVFLSELAYFGFGVGFNGMLIIVLLILSDRKKARRPIFILNFVCLALNTIRYILDISIVCSQYVYGVGENFLAAIAQYPLSLWVTPNFIAIIFNIILYACILASLIMQVRVVFSAEPRTQLYVTVVLTVGALLAQGCWMAFEIQVVRGFFGVNPAAENNIYPTLYKIVKIIFIIIVGIACLLFLCKLFVTIMRRRRMGFQSFGPLHILFIMFGQCLVIPRKLNISIVWLMNSYILYPRLKSH